MAHACRRAWQRGPGRARWAAAAAARVHGCQCVRMRPASPCTCPSSAPSTPPAAAPPTLLRRTRRLRRRAAAWRRRVAAMRDALPKDGPAAAGRGRQRRQRRRRGPAKWRAGMSTPQRCGRGAQQPCCEAACKPSQISLVRCATAVSAHACRRRAPDAYPGTMLCCATILRPSRERPPTPANCWAHGAPGIRALKPTRRAQRGVWVTHWVFGMCPATS